MNRQARRAAAVQDDLSLPTVAVLWLRNAATGSAAELARAVQDRLEAGRPEKILLLGADHPGGLGARALWEELARDTSLPCPALTEECRTLIVRLYVRTEASAEEVLAWVVHFLPANEPGDRVGASRLSRAQAENAWRLGYEAMDQARDTRGDA